jgi:hypothetical protein
MVLLLTKILLARNSVRLSLLSVLLILGIFSGLSYQQFLFLQGQNISQLSVFNEVIQPLSGLALMLQLIMMCIAGALLLPHFSAKGQQGVIVHSACSNSSMALSLIIPIIVIGALPLIYFIIVATSFWLVSDLDSWLLISTVFGLFSAGVLFSVVITAVCIRVKGTLIALLSSVLLVGLVLAIDEWLRSYANGLGIFLDYFFHLRSGLVSPFDVVRWCLWLLVSMGVVKLALASRTFRKDKKDTALIGFSAVGLVVGLMLNQPNFGIAAEWSSVRWDISTEKRHSLDPNWVDKIAAVELPIEISAVIDDEVNHDEIKQAVDVISQHHANTQLNFTTRQSLSTEVAFAGEFVSVSVGKQQQSVAYPFNQPAKQVLAKLIVQLTTRANNWISFVEGHSEASPLGNSSKDISSFYQILKSLGWPIVVQNLSQQPVIGNNTKLLVIAASEKQWLPSEVSSVMSYLHKGGNLLLLREQGDRLPIQIEDFTQVAQIDGSLIDWQGYQSGTPHPAILIIDQVTEHPVNTGIESYLAFPWSSGLRLKLVQGDFTHEPIIVTHSGVWNEHDSQAETLSYNEELGESRQSFVIAYAISRPSKQQKLVVVGDASFLSDAAINNYSNKQFSLNIISYLSSETMTAAVQHHLDNVIRVNPLGHWLFKWLFSLVIPASLGLLYLLNYYRDKVKFIK